PGKSCDRLSCWVGKNIQIIISLWPPPCLMWRSRPPWPGEPCVDPCPGSRAPAVTVHAAVLRIPIPPAITRPRIQHTSPIGQAKDRSHNLARSPILAPVGFPVLGRVLGRDDAELHHLGCGGSFGDLIVEDDD